MDIDALYERIFRLFRPRRLRAFYRLFGIEAGTRILDLGGTPYWWRLAAELGLPAPRVTILNLDPPPGPLPAGVRWVRGDGCALPFAANSFDVALSNSVIEHLYTSGHQEQFAAEIQRVAARWWVQTPDFRFPIEPHYLAPPIHWLPPGLRRRAIRWCTPWGWIERPNARICERLAREIRILHRSEFGRLFPGSEILVERLLGLPKSMIAARR
jgi:Methyltransferase domain